MVTWVTDHSDHMGNTFDRNVPMRISFGSSSGIQPCRSIDSLAKAGTYVLSTPKICWGSYVNNC